MSWRGLKHFIVENLAPLDASAKVLNVGAGGRTAEVVDSVRRARGFQVISLDIDLQRGPDIVADITNYSSRTEYDVVVMIEVLEHVVSPQAAISNVHHLLKPGGRLILSTPFLFPLHDCPMDYYRYTKFGLRRLLEEFADITVEERDSWAEVMCVLTARLFRERFSGAKLIGSAAVLIAAMLYPFAVVLSSVIRADGYTTGYKVTATKRR
jgi:SAM-dependent methyltransferase